MATKQAAGRHKEQQRRRIFLLHVTVTYLQVDMSGSGDDGEEPLVLRCCHPLDRAAGRDLAAVPAGACRAGVRLLSAAFCLRLSTPPSKVAATAAACGPHVQLWQRRRGHLRKVSSVRLHWLGDCGTELAVCEKLSGSGLRGCLRARLFLEDTGVLDATPGALLRQSTVSAQRIPTGEDSESSSSKEDDSSEQHTRHQLEGRLVLEEQRANRALQHLQHTCQWLTDAQAWLESRTEGQHELEDGTETEPSTGEELGPVAIRSPSGKMERLSRAVDMLRTEHQLLLAIKEARMQQQQQHRLATPSSTASSSPVLQQQQHQLPTTARSTKSLNVVPPLWLHSPHSSQSSYHHSVGGEDSQFSEEESDRL